MNTDLRDLFTASENDDRKRIEDLLTASPKLADTPDEEGKTAVFAAARKGHYDLVRFYVEYSFASMNVWDNQHRSLLHYAAEGDNPDCFAYLVDRISLNPLEVDSDMNTPLDRAHETGARQIIHYYRDTLGLNRENLYKNPVVPGAYPDPSVVRVGHDYYMVHSSFFYFPCIPVLHSTDLVHWKTIGHGITDSNYIDLSRLEDGRGFWAPDISWHGGMFYITATLRLNDSDKIRRKQMIIRSEKPEGPYSPPVFIEEDGIDPSLFTDDDGRRYMLLNRGARILELSPEGDKKISESRMLWYGAQKRAPEAPHMLKKDGYYYLFVAEGGTGINHQISVARSRELTGVYEPCPFNPILIQNDPDHPIQRSGHGKLVSTPGGDWYVLYLCSRMIDHKYSILGRETALDRVIWTSDGWPLINGGKGPSGAAVLPDLTGVENTGHTALSDEWLFVRNPALNFISQDVRNNAVTITAGPDDLSSLSARNIIVRRQTSIRFTARIKVVFESCGPGTEGGMTCYYDTSAYLKFGLACHGKKTFLTLTEHKGTEDQTAFSKEIQNTGTIELKIITNALVRTFLFRRDKDSGWETLGTLENVFYLSDEGIPGKKFTGPMVGLYALDKTGSDRRVVRFDDFALIPGDGTETHRPLYKENKK